MGKRTTSILRFSIALAASCIALVLLLPVLALWIPIWLLTAMSRAIAVAIRRGSRAAARWEDLILPENEVGWRPKADFEGFGYHERKFHLTTDPEGWRLRTSVAEADIVVFGDSFAFGTGISDRDFFASQAAGARIKSIGANGYNMVQSLIWMERMSQRLKDKLVVWMVYYANDLLENLSPNMASYRIPFVRYRGGDSSWEIMKDHVSSEPWEVSTEPRYYDRLVDICNPDHVLSRRAFSAARFLVEAGSRVCEQAGSSLVVVGVPDKVQLSETAWFALTSSAGQGDQSHADWPDRAMADICDQVGVRFETLRGHLGPSEYKPTDVHWNRRGNRKVARVLSRIHAEQKAIDRSGGDRYLEQAIRR